MSRKISGNRTAEDVIREYERKLAENKSKVAAPKPRQIAPVKATNVNDPEKYIVLSGNSHGTYSYPDLLVSTERTHQDKTWYQTHEDLQKEDSFMLTIRQYVDFLNLLKSGTASDGSGKQFGKSKLDAILSDIVEIKDPWRAEWLDAKFGKNTITYHKIKTDGTLEEVTEPLRDCLMEDRQPGIDYDNWLKNATPQGLPPKNISKGDLWYWAPREDAVASFGASSVGAYLYCYGGPRGSYPALGVRAAVVAKQGVSLVQ